MLKRRRPHARLTVPSCLAHAHTPKHDGVLVLGEDVNGMIRLKTELTGTSNRGASPSVIWRYRILVALMSLMMVAAFGACGSDEQTLSFDLPASTGGTVKLSDLREKGDVVVVFYRGNF